MSTIDNETKAIGEIAAILDRLEEDQRARVMRYISERFGLAMSPHSTQKPHSDAVGRKPSISSSEFEDFASLVDACNPSTDSTRALVAGYWLQVCQGGQSFDGQSANKELKHLGHSAANITNALSALINQKPALVLQLRKSGSTRQARKLYKVTDAGVRKVKLMMAGNGENE